MSQLRENPFTKIQLNNNKSGIKWPNVITRDNKQLCNDAKSH